jgi:hypothetical protein
MIVCKIYIYIYIYLYIYIYICHSVIIHYPKIVELCELVLTIPVVIAADCRSFSALKRLKKLFRKFS